MADDEDGAIYLGGPPSVFKSLQGFSKYLLLITYIKTGMAEKMFHHTCFSAGNDK